MAAIALRASHTGHLDDEIVALTPQLEEINCHEKTRKAKYPFNNIPDLEVANSNYLSEIEAHLAFLKDVKLAHSIANAVNTDTQAIADITLQNQQEHDDHQMAVHMSSSDHDMEAPPPYTQEVRNNFNEDEIVRRLAKMLTTDDDYR